MRALALVTVVALALVSLLAFAMRSHGYPATTVDLNDAGIWVTSDKDGLVGRLNKSASSLDAMMNLPGGSQVSYSLDVYQDQGTVVARDAGEGKVVPVNVRTDQMAPDGAVQVSPTAVVDMRGGTIAALDPATGTIHAARYDGTGLPSLDSLGDSSPPVATIGATPKAATASTGAAYSSLAVGVDGTIFAADLTGRLATVKPSGEGFAKASYSSLGAVKSVELSSVGMHLALLDAVSGTVTIDGGTRISLGGSDPSARIQQPGADSGSVLVATTKSLYAVPVRGGSLSTIFGSAEGKPAAPVRVGDCSYGAWAGSPGAVVRQCGSQAVSDIGLDRKGGLSRPVFRVNRGSVVLNDAADGRVFDVDLRRSVDNWQAQQQQQQPQKQHQATKVPVTTRKKQKPKAVKDNLGARPGRTTVLHVLDNDSDSSDRVLSIVRVTQPGNKAASVSIAPDGQTLIYTLGEAGGDSDFQYAVSNGAAEATGDVHVAAHGPGVNGPPYLRAGSEPRLTVASGGTISVQAIPNWRDPDGDPVSLASVTASAGSAVLTSDGRIEYTAPSTGKGGVEKLRYAVTDGIVDKPTTMDLSITVQAPAATRGVAAVTEPDVAKGEVGRSLSIDPLANDIPGADPLNPQAALQLSAPVTSKDGVKVTSDLTSGQVVVTPTRVGSYFLSYSVGFGSAPLATGQIRVDATAATKQTPSPVAMPDSAAVRGQGSILVDVLANDVDPLGSVLTVQRATPHDPGEVQAAVIGGRWLRITPATARFTTNPQTVSYTVTNGVSAPATGVVSVTQLPAISPDSIVVRPDYATVRDGDSTLIPVLDNDSALSGAALSLASSVPDGKVAGRLPVVDPSSADPSSGDVGTAYVSGNQIRYVAPAKVTVPTTLQIEYVAQTASGDTGTGTVEVTVNPQPDAKNTDRAPEPSPIDARATAGETVTIPVPSSGIDPDGDSTSVVGIGSAPTLGRVTGISPTGITYQAYPDSAGTDTFTYDVTDRYGQVASSLIRLAVTPPTRPSEPVATPITVTAEPGAMVTVYPLTSALYAKTDTVSVVALARSNTAVPRGVRLDAASDAVTAPTPAASARPLQVSYQLVGNGGTSPSSTITVIGQEGFKNPPHIQDQTATVDGHPTSTVDVLKTAYDPDGDSSKLRVTSVDDAAASIHGGSVVVPVTDHPQAIPYEVTDESGAVSAAVIYVPAQGVGGPYLKPGALITVRKNTAATVPLSDYIADARGRTVRLTTTDRMWASPSAELSVAAKGDQQLRLTPTKDYVGPAAVTVEVTDGSSLSDPQGIRQLISIPVQIGPETPVIRCPSDPVAVVAGGQTVDLDITSLCSVWTPTPAMAASLTYRASWSTPIGNVTATSKGSGVAVTAAGSAKPGGTGTLAITANGYQTVPATLHVLVQGAPKPRLAPIELAQMKQGESRTIDVASYLTSPLRDAVPTAISLTQVSGQAARTSVSGSTATITPGTTSHGRMTFTLVASDLADRSDTSRQVSTTVSFDVFGVPDTPTHVQPGSSVLSRSATVSWSAPAANGAPIDYYQVSASGGRSQKCASSPCTITGLDNGTAYTFTVMAHNKAGFSKPSAPSSAYTPNKAPGQVPGFHQTAAGDHSVTLGWTAAHNDGSPITDYVIAVNGRTISAGTGLSTTVSGLSNGPKYTFTIVAKNSYKPGPSTTTTGSAAGAPILPSPPTVTQTSAADADVAAVRISWAAADPNGPESPTYTVTRSDGKTVYQGSSTSADDSGMSYSRTYVYTVTAHTTFLGVTRDSSPRSTSYTVKGKPGVPTLSNLSESSGSIDITVSWPSIHGQSGTVTLGGVGGSPSYAISGGSADGGSHQFHVSGLTNGTTYQVSATVANDTGGSTSSGSVSATPFGVPQITGVSASVSGTSITFSWAADPQGASIDSYQVSWSGDASGSGTAGGGNNGSQKIDVGYGKTVTFTVVAHNKAGKSQPGSKQATTDTPRIATTTHQDGCTKAAGCQYVFITLTGWTPNSTVYCFAQASPGGKNWYRHITVGGDGNAGAFDQGDSGVGYLYDTPGYRYGPTLPTNGLSCSQ